MCNDRRLSKSLWSQIFMEITEARSSSLRYATDVKQYHGRPFAVTCISPSEAVMTQPRHTSRITWSEPSSQHNFSGPILIGPPCIGPPNQKRHHSRRQHRADVLLDGAGHLSGVCKDLDHSILGIRRLVDTGSVRTMSIDLKLEK